MTSTSCKEIGEELLARCLAGNPPEEIPPALLDEPCAQSLFGIWVEGLADRFDETLCDVYVRLFAQALVHAGEAGDPNEVIAWYQRIRRPRPVSVIPRRVVVLSRVTLGADVAVTSVLLAAARKRFPSAELVLASPRKNYELFAGDSAIQHAPVEYRRGSLHERLSVAQQMRDLARDPDTLVIDPDSRFTQLGLLSVCPEERYRFFESRAYGGGSARALPALTELWARETLGVDGAKPFVALPAGPKAEPWITVSLGVGENPAKRIADPFEEELLRLLARAGSCLYVDTGAGGAEAERVRCAVARSGVQAQLWEGSFAGFASIIAGSRLYVGYDSAGGHVAAACGVPLISIFAGFPSPRMFARWQPSGPRATVIRVDRPDPGETLERVKEALAAHA